MASTSSAVEYFFICSKISAALSLVSIKHFEFEKWKIFLQRLSRIRQTADPSTRLPFASEPESFAQDDKASCVALIAFIRGAYLHIAKPGRRSAVARAHDLLRLPLAAV